MEVKGLFYLFLITLPLSAAIPFDGSFASFDNGMGTALYSPLLPASYKQDSTRVLLEMGAVSYYQYSLTTSEERLYTAHWGGTVAFGQRHILSAGIRLFSAFELYQELYPQISYGIQPLEALTLSATATPMIASIADSSALEWGGDLSTAVQGKALSFIGGWSISHYDPNLSELLENRIYLFLRARENRLGAQGARISYTIEEETVSFSLAETMELSPWFSMNCAVQSSPFLLFLGGTFTLTKGRGGVVTVRHPLLGWSSGVTVQYYDE